MAGPSRHPTSEASGGLSKCEVRSVKSETNHLTSAVWREPTGPSQLPTKPRLVPPPSQPEFDFDRGDRLALLDALPLASGSVHDGRASVRVSGATAKSVLRAIEAHGRTTGQCWASATTIGAEINRSERTVRRAIGYLESIEMLIIDRAAGKSPRCRINWGEISLKTNSKFQVSSSKFQVKQPSHAASHKPTT